MDEEKKEPASEQAEPERPPLPEFCCGRCACYAGGRKDGIGLCTLDPPRTIDRDYPLSEQPMVRLYDRCSRFRAVAPTVPATAEIVRSLAAHLNLDSEALHRAVRGVVTREALRLWAKLAWSSATSATLQSPALEALRQATLPFGAVDMDPAEVTRNRETVEVFLDLLKGA